MQTSVEDLARENPESAREFLTKYITFVNRRYQEVEPIDRDTIREFLKSIS